MRREGRLVSYSTKKEDWTDWVKNKQNSSVYTSWEGSWSLIPQVKWSVLCSYCLPKRYSDPALSRTLTWQVVQTKEMRSVRGTYSPPWINSRPGQNRKNSWTPGLPACISSMHPSCPLPVPANTWHFLSEKAIEICSQGGFNVQESARGDTTKAWMVQTGQPALRQLLHRSEGLPEESEV